MAARRRSPGPLGSIIRQQRELASLPMRQLAAMVGISNPYLSQIERGLRTPSERVLEAIAASLHLSADALVEHVPPTTPDGQQGSVLQALADDPLLDEQSREALRVLYLAAIDRRRGGETD